MKNNPMAGYALDLLMMTNGWRRYNIPEVMAGQYQKLRIPSKNGYGNHRQGQDTDPGQTC